MFRYNDKRKFTYNRENGHEKRCEWNTKARQPTLSECYEFIRGGDGKNIVKRIVREKGTGEYVNGVGETAGKKETANIFEYRYEEEGRSGKRTEYRLMWLTNIEITHRNPAELIEAGRGRWKIENGGFNNQKNGIYDIEHSSVMSVSFRD